jgi:uncharacterized protein with NAD-binding domain and iron-sulfur cluster
MEDPREHIVILGGGVGACVAAYWLSSTEELRKKYRVTVYQTGWRLGGKGASSRNPEERFRSEEHGPHVWFGFYENAFTTLRRCMEAHHAMGWTVGAADDWTGLFEASREGVFYNPDDAGNWHPWKVQLDTYPGSPGDDQPQPDVRETLWRAADLLALNLDLKRLFGPWTRRVTAWIGGILGRKLPVSVPETCRFGINPGDPGGLASYLSRRLVDLAGSERHWYGEAVTGRALRIVLDLIGWRIRREARKPGLSQEELRQLSLIDLCRTCLRGALVDLLIRDKHFSQLDGIEFLTWLESHGATYHSLKYSPLLRGYYDTPFAFTDGKPHVEECANFAAGAALRGFFRIFFGHKGAYLYRMKLGMGECVFVPLYRVLKARGVKFEFFHRVESLEPNEQGNRVESIRFSRQARVVTGSGEYEALAEVKIGDTVWPYWPPRPDASQLDPASLPPAGDPGFESAWSGHAGEPVVIADRRAGGIEAAGRFDHVILAIPPGEHGRIAGPLMKKDTRFRVMVETSETIRTVACQIWISGGDGSHGGLGWDRTRTFCEYMLAAATRDPLNVAFEATPILATEATGGARHLLYLCGPAEDDPAEPPHGSDPGYPARQRAAAKELCVRWLHENAHLWPGLCLADGETLDFAALYHPDSRRQGPERLDWQYFRLNIDPAERYVLSTTGAAPNRLAPWESGFNNLLHAGDWCRNRIDIGCVESAATSAMLAVNHLTGYPAKEMIAGMQYE